MNGLIIALRFLTIIPAGKPVAGDENKLAQSLIYFPLVGLILGAVLVGLYKLLGFLAFDKIAANFVIVVALISLTGGLHMDGLADTADAILSRKNRDEMLRIMRDSRIGAMGVMGIISIVLLKIAILASVGDSTKAISLLLMCSLSRWSLVFSMYLFPYAREEGRAKVFIEGINFRKFAMSTIIVLLCAAGIWKIKGLAVFLIVAAGTYITGKLISNKVGGITGDTLGAVNEISEIIALFGVFIIGLTP